MPLPFSMQSDISLLWDYQSECLRTIVHGLYIDLYMYSFPDWALYWNGSFAHLIAQAYNPNTYELHTSI